MEVEASLKVRQPPASQTPASHQPATSDPPATRQPPTSHPPATRQLKANRGQLLCCVGAGGSYDFLRHRLVHRSKPEDTSCEFGRQTPGIQTPHSDPSPRSCTHLALAPRSRTPRHHTPRFHTLTTSGTARSSASRTFALGRRRHSACDKSNSLIVHIQIVILLSNRRQQPNSPLPLADCSTTLHKCIHWLYMHHNVHSRSVCYRH